MNFNMTILGQSISFILFVLFCMKYVWSPLILIIEKRQKIIADDLEAAKCNKLESDRLYKQAKKNLVNSQIKSQEIIRKANVYKTKILSEAIKEANQKKDQILLKAEEQIIYERKRVFDEIKNEIFQLVILSTEKIIKNYMTNAIDQKIVNDVVNAIDLNKE